MKKILFTLFVFSVVFLSSCASKPKRPMLVNTVATSAGTMVENGKACISNGNYEKAEYFLDNAYKLAMSVDNNDLLTTVCLTRISAYLSEIPQKIEEAELELENAKEFAANSRNINKNKALCVLSEVRIALVKENPDYNSLIKKLDDAKLLLGKAQYEIAQCESVKADVYRLQKKYSESEEAYQNAIKIFTKECYLSELGLQWYKVSQVRSLNGNKNGALEALETAIKYDRDSENSNALGTDYYIKGVILMKDNPSEAQINEAKKAFIHSADIFDAAELKDLAQRSRDKLQAN